MDLPWTFAACSTWSSQGSIDILGSDRVNRRKRIFPAPFHQPVAVNQAGMADRGLQAGMADRGFIVKFECGECAAYRSRRP
jgi:hypothetical protein